MDSSSEALHRLSIYFGHSGFRTGQAEVIETVMAGRDSLVVMPTGGGKSICYQLPATMLPGITLVVSPLIALMRDQVDSLNRCGIPAIFINSTLSSTEVARRCAILGLDGIKLVYVAPERFRSLNFVDAISRATVSLLAIDEAHCVSHWGHDFRPEYLKLNEAAEMLGRPPVIALTATATGRVRRDIVAQLRLRDPAVFVTGFDRPNLRLRVLQTGGDKDKLSTLKAQLAALPGTGIVYAATRRSVEQITSRLKVAGLAVEAYHAGLHEKVRTQVQERFANGALKAIVATNAFGMGIDKRNIRFVIHYHVPGSLEAYYQEIGRAGRDGNPADCILLFNYADTRFQRLFIDSSFPSSDLVKRTLEVLTNAAASAEQLSSTEIARAVGVKDEAAVRSALNMLEKAGQTRWSGRQPLGTNIALAVPCDIALDRFPDSTKEGMILRHLIFEEEIDGREAEIDEESLAGELAIRPLAVRDSLSKLAELGVIHRRRSDLRIAPRLLDERDPDRLETELASLSERLSAEHQKLRRMVEYCYHRRCLRLFVLQYFGDTTKTSDCGECSSCDPLEEENHAAIGNTEKPASGVLVIKSTTGGESASLERSPDQTPVRAASRRRGSSSGLPGDERGSAICPAKSSVALSVEQDPPAEPRRPLTEGESQIANRILECVSRFDGRFGKGTIASVLAGSDSLEIRTHKLNNSPGYGTLTGLPVAAISSFIKSLIEANCISVSGGGYPTLGLTDLGRQVIRGQKIDLHI